MVGLGEEGVELVGEGKEGGLVSPSHAPFPTADQHCREEMRKNFLKKCPSSKCREKMRKIPPKQLQSPPVHHPSVEKK